MFVSTKLQQFFAGAVM